MSAFNILLFSQKISNEEILNFEIQFHVASSFSGNEISRFFGNKYIVDDLVIWYDRNNINYQTWVRDASYIDSNNNTCLEVCYGICLNNKREIACFIQFDNLKITRIFDIIYIS